MRIWCDVSCCFQDQKSRYSHYQEERVSPPPSDFLIGDAVVTSALDKYSKLKKSVENLTDDELIEAEEKRGTAI